MLVDKSTLVQCSIDSVSIKLFCINNKIILSAVKELSDQPLVFNINTSDYCIDMSYQNGSYRIIGQSAVEYPRMQQLVGDHTTITMSCETLLNNISRTIFATAQDELRMVMNGIYFDLCEDNLSIVASDGHKLVRDRLFAVKGNEKAAFIMQKKPATVLKGLLAKEADDVAISFDSRNVVFTTPTHTMVCRLIDGRYPNYNSVIPQNNPYKVTINRQSLLSALKRVSVCSSASSSLIKLHLQNNEVHISAQDIDFASSAEEKIVCQYVGEPMSIGFKSTFLIDIISNISGEDINIEVSDPSRAGVLTPAAQEDESDLLMLLMPMMLND